MGNGNDGAGVVWRFNDNINFALAELAFKLHQKTDFFVKQVLTALGFWANQQINIAPLLAVIRARTKQPNTCTRTKNRSRSGANGGLLILA